MPDDAEADGRHGAGARASIRSRCAQYLGDGNFGGLYQRPDDEMLALWQVAVEETRALLTGSWGDADPDGADDMRS